MDLQATTVRLWQTAPYWKYSVWGAGLFSLLFTVHLFDGPSSSSVDPVRYSPVPAVTPIVPSDPAADARLADYQVAHDQALKLSPAGQRCEKMVAGLEALTADDVRRGRNPRIAPATLFKALADGESCRGNLVISDKHFDVLSGATASAQATRTPAAVLSAIAALKALDAFDRSRSRFLELNPIVSAAQGLEREEAASTGRLADLARSVTAYQQDHTAPTARQAAEALDRLSPYDQEKARTTQPAMLQGAIEASARVRDGKARLTRVIQLLAAAQANATPAARRALVEATTSIMPFDEALASPEETKSLALARGIARKELWDLARQRLQELDQSPTPDNYQRVAALGAPLEGLSQTDTTADELAILARVQAAATKLAQSDNRLAALVAAAAWWKKDGLNAASTVLQALAPIEDFDRRRFRQAEMDAQQTLIGAASVIRGPDLGLNSRTKTNMAIAVLPAGGNRLDSAAARALADQLTGRGFHVVTDRQAAALLASVSISRLPPPQLDWKSQVAQFTADADVTAVFSWQYGNTLLLTCNKTGDDRGRDDAGLSGAAVLKAVINVADCLNSYTEAQPSP